MRKCGFHVQQTSNELRRAIEIVQPTLCVSLAHDADFWRGVKADFPWIFQIGRLFEVRAGFSSDWRQVNPREWAEECARQGMPYDAWITRNEPDGITNEVTADDARRYDDWCVRFRERALELGFEAVGPNVPAGNWHHYDIVNYLPNLCQTFRYIGIHEYSARAMWDQAPALERAPSDVPRTDGEERGWWYCGRYRGWKRAVCERWPGREGRFQMVVTEGGVAYGVIPDAEGRPKYGDVGWRTDMSEADYLASLDWYTRLLNEDDYVLGWAIFMVGAADPRWASFETLPQCPRLVSIPEVGAPPQPEEPEGEMEELRVYDLDGNLLTGAAAVDKIAYHGLTITQPGGLVSGQKFLQLVKLEEREGPACFIFTVLKEDGTPWHNVETAWAWADDMGDANDIETSYPTDWQAEADVGPTNENGNNGPGMGKTGWYHGPYQSGPGRAWVRHPQLWATRLTGIGMEAGTNHRTMYGTWKVVTYTGAAPAPEPTPPASDDAALLLQMAADLTAIAGRMRAGQVVSGELVLHLQDGSRVELGVAPKAGLLAAAWAKVRGLLR